MAGLMFPFLIAAAEVDSHYQAPGTRRMNERLQQWAKEFGDKNPYANSAALKSYVERIPQAATLAERIKLQHKLAEELLNAGRPEECLVAISNLSRMMQPPRPSVSSNTRRIVRLLEGLAWMRLGEQENCLQHHNPDSCLLPIRGGGQHVEKRGSTNAEAVFAQLARQRTNDLGARWLFNVAAMTLGKYPGHVPHDLLIPPKVFESDYALPKFPEIAAQVGLAVNDLAGGVVAEDFDGDGLLDVLLSTWNATGQCHYFKNTGNGQFEERTTQAGLLGVTGGLNVLQTDYNNDGWPDLYFVRGAWLGELGRLPDSLLKNNGDGTFADVTEEAGLLSFHPALSAVWFDANNDGWIDLFVGNETIDAQQPHPCELFLNDGQGRFRECAAEAGIAITAFVRGVTAGDFDNDGWPDLYVSCLGEDNMLLRNEGRASKSGGAGVRFQVAPYAAQVMKPSLSFPAWFWDFDNDGWLDIFACGYGADLSTFSAGGLGHSTLTEVTAAKLGLPNKAETARLYRNRRDGSFNDVSSQLRVDRPLLGMGANFGDLDNDGFLDFYVGTGAPYFGSLLPNEMFRNNAGRQFQDVTTAGGFGHLQKGHGVAFADLNNDGQQDVLLNVGGAFTGDNYFDALFANPGNANRWLCLKLVGKESNHAAIGTRIKVVASTKGKPREIHRVVGSGGSFGSSPLRQEIGLGNADKVERVEVWWPVTGKTNVVANLELDRFYEFAEGDKEARALTPRRFGWPGVAVSTTTQ